VDRGVLRCPGPHARVDVIEPGRPTVTSRYFNSALVGLKDGAEPVPAGDMVAGHEPLTSGAGDWATYIREAVAPSMERLRRARCLGGRPPRGRAPPRVRGALGGTVDLERELASLDGPAMAGYRTLARPAGRLLGSRIAALDTAIEWVGALHGVIADSPSQPCSRSWWSGGPAWPSSGTSSASASATVARPSNQRSGVCSAASADVGLITIRLVSGYSP
jgi:hypothetical protein